MHVNAHIHTLLESLCVIKRQLYHLSFLLNSSQGMKGAIQELPPDSKLQTPVLSRSCCTPPTLEESQGSYEDFKTR